MGVPLSRTEMGSPRHPGAQQDIPQLRKQPQSPCIYMGVCGMALPKGLMAWKLHCNCSVDNKSEVDHRWCG